MKQGAMSARPSGSRRRAGARAHKRRRAATGPPGVAGVRRRIPIYRLLSEEGLDLIDRTTDRILEEIGLHAAGWLEAGLAIGYEKLVLDADPLGAVHTLLAGLALDPGALALDAFEEVGPGNHFFGCAHTLSRYETAFHECEIADTDSYENWSEAGGKDSMMRANAKWKGTLRACEPPPLDASVDEALKEFMARKKASMPDVWH